MLLGLNSQVRSARERSVDAWIATILVVSVAASGFGCKPRRDSQLRADAGGAAALEVQALEQTLSEYVRSESSDLADAIDNFAKVATGKYAYLTQEEVGILDKAGVLNAETPSFATKTLNLDILRPYYLVLPEHLGGRPFDPYGQELFKETRAIIEYSQRHRLTQARRWDGDAAGSHLFLYVRETVVAIALKDPSVDENAAAADGKPAIPRVIYLALVPLGATPYATETQRQRFQSPAFGERYTANPQDWVYAVVASGPGNEFRAGLQPGKAATPMTGIQRLQNRIDTYNGAVAKDHWDKTVIAREIASQQIIAVGLVAATVATGGYSAGLAYGLGVGMSAYYNATSVKERGATLASLSFARDVVTGGLLTKYKAIAVVAQVGISGAYILHSYVYFIDHDGQLTALDKLDMTLAVAEVASGVAVMTRFRGRGPKLVPATNADGTPLVVRQLDEAHLAVEVSPVGGAKTAAGALDNVPFTAERTADVVRLRDQQVEILRAGVKQRVAAGESVATILEALQAALQRRYKALVGKRGVTVADIAAFQAESRVCFDLFVDSPAGAGLRQGTPDALAAKNGYKELLDGLLKEDKAAFLRILELFRGRAPFDYLQQMELEVIARSRERHANGGMMATFAEMLSPKALEDVLGRWEADGGFKPVIDLAREGYLPDKWLEMLRGGALFRDTAFGANAVTRKGHGVQTHRLQWNILMRDMRAHPDIYTKPAVEYFKMLGRSDVAAKYRSQQPRSFWNGLFDTFEDNFSSPEWFKPQHHFWPGLGRWL